VTSSEFVVDEAALELVFLWIHRLFLLIITAPLLYNHLSPAHEVCDIPDQAAHDHTLGNELSGPFLVRHLNGLLSTL
jgi:hypothetical protein